LDRTIDAMPLARYLALAGLVAACAGCVIDHDVPVELDFAGQDRSSLATYVLGVYEGDICDSLEINDLFPVFAFNVEVHSELRRHLQFFEPGTEVPVGELPPGTYSFVGLGLDSSCLPLYAGCSLLRIEDIGEVAIEMDSVNATVPFCLLGDCAEGQCTSLL
jgi:hypothetical protein